MKVLITGANGFVGSNLCNRLAAVGSYTVTAVDLHSSRLQLALRAPRFAFVQADIVEEFEGLDRLIAASDLVIPLAAIANPIRYVREPLAVFRLNFETNLRIIRACARHDCRVIFPSSSEVYGLSTDEAFDEETTNFVFGPVSKPRWIYASSKQLLERVIHAHGLETGLCYTIFRPFNWFGPGLDDDLDASGNGQRVTASFVQRAMRFKDLPIVDGGHQKRAFLYIDDAIDALLRIIANESGSSNGRTFNIGHPGNLVTIRELARLVIEIVASRPGFEKAKSVRLQDVPSSEFFGRNHQEIAYRQPSIAAVSGALGWQPHTALRAGLEKTVDHYIASVVHGEEPR